MERRAPFQTAMGLHELSDTPIIPTMGHLTMECAATLTGLSMDFELSKRALQRPRKYIPFWELCPAPFRITYVRRALKASFLSHS